MSGKVIILQGKTDAVREMEPIILELLSAERKSAHYAQHLKTVHGLKKYLMHLGSIGEVIYHDHWKSSPDVCKVLLVQADSIYKDVEMIVLDTWDPNKVAQGYNAKGLKEKNYKKIAVQNIWRLENPKFYDPYYERRRKMCLDASVNDLIPPTKGLKDEAEIKTRLLGL